MNDHDVAAVDLLAAIREAFQHVARGYRSHSSHDPFVYEVAFDAALARLEARLEASEKALREIADADHKTNWCLHKQIARRALAGKDAAA